MEDEKVVSFHDLPCPIKVRYLIKQCLELQKELKVVTEKLEEAEEYNKEYPTEETRTKYVATIMRLEEKIRNKKELTKVNFDLTQENEEKDKQIEYLKTKFNFYQEKYNLCLLNSKKAESPTVNHE